jgi:hypothetical protein
MPADIYGQEWMVQTQKTLENLGLMYILELLWMLKWCPRPDLNRHGREAGRF